MDTRQQHNPKTSPDEWYTPRWIIDTLGPFDIDPCASPSVVRPFEIAPVAYTKDDDGLTHDWHGTVWMNPPYSRILLRQFCERMAAHGDGIALLVNRQDNLLWQEVIFPSARSMIFMRHRVKFIRPDGTTGSPFFGSCLVAWGDECERRLRNSGIEGKYVVLNV
jgi:phage N-6-adenine-methyltransferase